MHRSRRIAVALAFVASIALLPRTQHVSASSRELRPAHGVATTCRPALIGGKHTCLTVGQKCNPKYDTQYHQYGFACHASRRLTRRAGRPPQQIVPPKIHVVKRSALDAPGYIFVAPKFARPQGPEIMDDRGRPVWFDLMSGGDQAADFRVQSYGGKPVLTWWQGSGFGIDARGVDYILDSSYRVIATVHAGNGLVADGHEFLLTPQGTALITVYQQVPYDLSSVGGAKDGEVVDGIVQEIDIATGRVLFEWHSLDHVALDESYEPVQSGETYDYFHINAVNLDNDGNLLISGRHTWTVYKVDRHSGQIIWRLGGKKSDFVLGAGVHFAWQHNPLPAGENTIRLFDNEFDGTQQIAPQSRVIWIHLDTNTKAATLVKAITRDLSVPAEGNAQALDNGNTFVGWGANGVISEFDPQGNLLFDAGLPGQYDTYRGYRFGWTGQPATKPIATAWTNANGRTSVDAIWNGATEVAHWRVLAGLSAAALVPVRTAAWNGLDTAITIPGIPHVVQVVALDKHGSVLATSPPVTAG